MFVVGGESLIDLISKPIGPDGNRELVAKAGGSPMNCAIALSKLGNDAGFLCPISRDSFGDFILEPLNAVGVNLLLKDRVREPSTLAVVTDDGKRDILVRTCHGESFSDLFTQDLEFRFVEERHIPLFAGQADFDGIERTEQSLA